MADITTAFVKQFGATVEQLSQQKGSKIRPCVRIESGIVGEQAFFDQLGATAAVQKTTRNSDTPLVKSDNERRMITMYDYEWADLIDKEDRLKMIIDPTGPYAQSAAWAMGRAMDDAIIAAAFGTAYSGKAGATAVPWSDYSSTNVVAVASAGLTVAKILSAKEILDKGDVDPEEERFMIVSPEQIANLLAITQVTSADYMNVKNLVEGKVDTFCGFKFVMSNRLGLATTKTRACIAFAKNGLMLAIASEIKAKIDERADKSYATQVYLSMGIGATRMEEKKVVQVNCLEA